MENVLIAFIIIFILVFAGLTLSEAMIASQDVLQASFQEMEARLDEQTRTNLTPVDATTFTDSTVNVTFRNTGSTRLSDFDQWDVIVQYYDNSEPADYHIGWLSYTSSAPFGSEWSVEGLYMNAAEETPEAFEPQILDPGEEIVLSLNVVPPVGPGQAIRAAVSLPNGVGASTDAIRNIPPELVTDLGLSITHGETGIIDSSLLLTTDADDETADLIYSVLTAPADGTLSPADTFSQVDVDNGLLSFTQDVSGDTSFEFTVTDGKDTIGPFSFPITVVNAEPFLAVDSGLALSSGSSETITSAMLNVTDTDNPPADLTYTVTSLPGQGTLVPGAVFTQEHINAGLLSYTHTGSGDDSFEFSVSDGETTVGPFEFQIHVS